MQIQTKADACVCVLCSLMSFDSAFVAVQQSVEWTSGSTEWASCRKRIAVSTEQHSCFFLLSDAERRDRSREELALQTQDSK